MVEKITHGREGNVNMALKTADVSVNGSGIAVRHPLDPLTAGEITEATLLLKDGRTARVTMHLIEGSKEEIETTFRQSIEAFFDMYPEI